MKKEREREGERERKREGVVAPWEKILDGQQISPGVTGRAQPQTSVTSVCF